MTDHLTLPLNKTEAQALLKRLFEPGPLKPMDSRLGTRLVRLMHEKKWSDE